MTTEIQELSEKLSVLYGAGKFHPLDMSINGVWLAEDSGRIAELADDNKLNTLFYDETVSVMSDYEQGEKYCDELYANHATKHDAARWARARCLLAIRSE